VFDTTSLRAVEKFLLTSKALEPGHKDQITLSLIKNVEIGDSQEGYTFPLLIILQAAVKRNMHYALI